MAEAVGLNNIMGAELFRVDNRFGGVRRALPATGRAHGRAVCTLELCSGFGPSACVSSGADASGQYLIVGSLLAGGEQTA